MNISAVRQALCTALRLRGAWPTATHEVFEYPAGASAKKPNRLEFTEVEATNAGIALAGEDDATITLNGRITTMSAGATDAKWRTAEDAATDLLIDLRTYLRDNPTVTSTANRVSLTSWNGAASQDDGGAIFYRLDFQLAVTIYS
jgi:hypothetical protein